MVNDLPAIFADFSDARKNGFIAAKEFKDEGNVLIGSYCTFMPQELALAMGAGSVSLCSTSDEMIAEAERDLPKNLCPLIKSSYGFGKADKCPYFYFADLVVGETTCDGKKKMFEIMGNFKPVHIMQLPNNPSLPASLDLWRGEMIRLKEALEDRFKVTITDDDVRRAIKLKNEERKALQALYDLTKSDPPAISGLDLFKVMYGATFKFHKEASVAELHKVKDQILKEHGQGDDSLRGKPRILLTGCPVGGATEKVIRAIEDNGGTIVYYENCTGGKAVEDLVDETEPDVYLALAKKYLKIGCSCMSPNPNRFKLLEEKIKEFQVDGVVDMELAACQPYSIETFNVRQLVHGLGLPYTSLETDYSQADVGQLTTRLTAFIEML